MTKPLHTKGKASLTKKYALVIPVALNLLLILIVLELGHQDQLEPTADLGSQEHAQNECIEVGGNKGWAQPDEVYGLVNWAHTLNAFVGTRDIRAITLQPTNVLGMQLSKPQT